MAILILMTISDLCTTGSIEAHMDVIPKLLEVRFDL